MDTDGRVRSYNARRGRLSALTVERMETLAPRRAIDGDGPWEPARSFARVAPVVLEVGCGHGAAALAYAAAHPEHDLVAVDVFTPALARMLAAADDRRLANLWLHQGDAMLLLTDRVPSSSLAAVHVFFPDPWPKAKHAKRRFISQRSLSLVADRLASGGELLVATDHDRYAAHVRSELAAHGGFEVIEGDRPPWRPTDGFEAKGLSAGRRISEFRGVRT